MGKGYIIAEEEVVKLIDHMVVDKRIARDLKQRSEQNRLNVVKSLGKWMYLCFGKFAYLVKEKYKSSLYIHFQVCYNVSTRGSQSQ